jgi:hypothetical protein
MTSGQGGQDPQQGGQPPPEQGWQAPPQQGWQAPPQQQGWQTPPPYGYAAAPSAPGQLPPEAPPRPDAVRFGIGAYVANLVLGLVGAVVTFSSIDSVIDAELASSGVAVSDDAVRAVLVVSAVIGLLFVALEALFIWFAWKGRNWARIVLFVLGGLGITGGLSALAQPTTGFLSALSVFQMIVLVVGIVLLTRRPSNEWYRAMTARRQAGMR